MTKWKKTTCYLPKWQWRAIKRLALEHDRSMRSLVEEALNDLLRKYEHGRSWRKYYDVKEGFKDTLGESQD